QAARFRSGLSVRAQRRCLSSIPADRTGNTESIAVKIKNTLYRYLLALLFVVAGAPFTAQGQTWYSTGWNYRKAITIDASNVGTGPHTSFPLLIDITDADLAARALSAGNDILCTSSHGTTKLSHQIESYVSASGDLV